MWDHVNEILNQSVARITEGVANFLPVVLALIVALLFALMLAWMARVVLRRFLRRVDFDGRLGQWGFSSLADWSPSKSPTVLVTRLASWTIILLGLLVGASAFNAELMSALMRRLFAYFPHVLAAIFVLVVGTFIARFLARSVLISAVNMQIHSARLVSLGVKWLVMVLTGAMALGHLGIGGEIVRLSFAILFGGIVLALALAIGLGSKEMVSRSWERQASKTEEHSEEEFHHL